ncbi:hypothetical protein M514_02397 [Trichuris suis]|uniref:Uncharacterized protein n=1 Tax=Trichuris suis TaxID=68888 RepID=A0A085MHM4_9BILA|nr:hypothetical protein M513_02397 [Trichuris suis]KFD64828.1 hypothetical protein M514_02397 [Trichuris suis]
MISSKSVGAKESTDHEINGISGRISALGSPTDPVQPTLERPRPRGAVSEHLRYLGAPARERQGKYDLSDHIFVL